jgi:hypothetical protein
MKSSRSASSQAVPAKKTSKKAAASAVVEIPAKPQKNKVIQDSREQVALRAYFIGERRSPGTKPRIGCRLNKS